MIVGQPVKPLRPYRSALRAEQAHATRSRILEAARSRFLIDGYAGASIASIAGAAGVAAETVYLVFGTKRRLLEEVVTVTIAGGFEQPALLEAAWVRDLRALPGLRERIAGFATHTAQTMERTAPLHAVTRVAAASDAELAKLHADIHDRRFENQKRVLDHLAAGTPATLEADAGDTFSALASPELHHVLRNVRGWSRARYSDWLCSTVVAALLPQGLR